MKQKIIFIVFLLSIVVRTVQAQTVSELFVNLPEPEYLTLTVSDRLDLIDMYKAGEKAEVKNIFGDPCIILKMTNDYLQLRIGESILELFLLTMINDSKIVGLIKTVCAPVCDSVLEFFTIRWKKIPDSVFINYANKYDFIKEGTNIEDEQVKNALVFLDISLMRFNYDPEKQELYQYYTTPEYLSETERAKVTQYLNETHKQFKWNQTRFE